MSFSNLALSFPFLGKIQFRKEFLTRFPCHRHPPKHSLKATRLPWKVSHSFRPSRGKVYPKKGLERTSLWSRFWGLYESFSMIWTLPTTHLSPHTVACWIWQRQTSRRLVTSSVLQRRSRGACSRNLSSSFWESSSNTLRCDYLFRKQVLDQQLGGSR